MRKIAIVGMSDFINKIPEDYEQWVIAVYIGHFTKYDRAFECHAVQLESNSTFELFIDDPWVPFYVPDHLTDIYPNASTIPVADLAEKYCGSFGSTISYMIACAISEGVDEIALYGVDMATKEEYVHHLPSAYYWMGVANGLGIKTRGLLKEQRYGEA